MCQSTSFKEAQSTNSVNPELQSKGPHARNRNAPDSNRAGERLAHGAQLARHRLRFKSEMHTDSQMWQERDRETKRESESARERERQRERERDKARERGREGEKGLDLLRDLVGMFGLHGYWAESKTCHGPFCCSLASPQRLTSFTLRPQPVYEDTQALQTPF